MIVATAALVTVASVAGCAGSTAGSSTDLQFVTDKSWDFEKFSAVSKDDIDVSLDPAYYADQNAFQAFIKQSFRSNKAPGLFTWHTGSSLEDLVSEGLVAETTDIWEKAVADGDISESVKDLYTIDGKQYCTPISVDDWVMYYDKRTFSELGLEVPTTWDEMMTVADTLVDAGIAPF
ncbi:hypothetical protein AUC47_12050 [Microbacterium sp. SZ1]|nr:hypothetical protein AUC47_12050 [Microbacterium sp. SZ1]